MSVFDNILGNWIQVVDNQNNITIEDYGYDTGVIEGTTKNHCVKCVAVNKCCFKNEENKKPKSFDITGIDILNSIINGLIPGLYHFRCHCKEVPVQINSIDEIELIVPEGKIQYLFKSKSGWIKSMGYQEKEFSEFVDMLLQKTKEAYLYGNYYKENYNNFGFKINLNISIPGKNEKIGKTYNVTTNYMIFPNKKLKMNTPLGGWQ